LRLPILDFCGAQGRARLPVIGTPSPRPSPPRGEDKGEGPLP